jgi:exopolyphosphatase/guanosine-5'-triphosphate,3'-diphosphate pyrophosphatase
MAHERRAVIDVGTNSVKLLVADVAGREVHPVLEAGQQTRLGQGFYETQRLQPAAIARTVATVAEFVAQARELKAGTVRVFATSAAREALNREDLIATLERACGLTPEIISGDQEAEWAFRGVRTHPGLAREPLLLVEVGGGSTQFILGQGDQTHFRASFLLGAVRLLEGLPHSDPPRPAELERCRQSVREFLESKIRPALEPALRREAELHPKHHAALLVGVGGTATVLARMEQGMEDYDRERIEAARLTRTKLETRVERLWSQPLVERKRIVGLPPERADVMLTGAVIYESVLRGFGFDVLRVSTRGLRFAAVQAAA